MSVEIQFNEIDLTRLQQIPVALQVNVFDDAMRKATAPILQRARQLAPRSNPADTAKRSKKQKEKADWDFPLHKTIAMVYRKTRNGGLAVLGPTWPRGNKAHFDYLPRVYGVGRKKVLWGRVTGEVVKKTNHFLKQALDQGKQQAIETFTRAIEEHFQNG